MRTFYDVLGVAADTPDVVIKAAYRALAKEYHPDGTNNDKDPDRFIEIQTAYAVLSKPNTRREYDAELQETFLYPPPAPPGEPPAGNALSPVPWPQPGNSKVDVERILARLGLYSEALAQAFHEAYLRGDCGEDPARHAEEMERNFFREYFGEDPDVQALARLLLLGSRTGAALTLNQLMAGDLSSPVKDIRTVLSVILDQHFKEEALFTEWLKVKFGIIAMDVRPVTAAAPISLSEAATAAVTTTSAKKTGKPLRRSHALRSIALIVMWAVALYFALFAALPLIQ